MHVCPKICPASLLDQKGHGWVRGCSVAKNTGCSSIRPGFSSQTTLARWLTNIHKSIPKESEIFWLLWALQPNGTHICMWKAHRKINHFFKKEKERSWAFFFPTEYFYWVSINWEFHIMTDHAHFSVLPSPIPHFCKRLSLQRKKKTCPICVVHMLTGRSLVLGDFPTEPRIIQSYLTIHKDPKCCHLLSSESGVERRKLSGVDLVP